MLWVNAVRMTVIPLSVSLLLAGIAASGAGTAAKVGGRAAGCNLGVAVPKGRVERLICPAKKLRCTTNP